MAWLNLDGLARYDVDYFTATIRSSLHHYMEGPTAVTVCSRDWTGRQQPDWSGKRAGDSCME